MAAVLFLWSVVLLLLTDFKRIFKRFNSTECICWDDQKWLRAYSSRSAPRCVDNTAMGYTRQELLNLWPTMPKICRKTRKTLFHYGLWDPRGSNQLKPSGVYPWRYHGRRAGRLRHTTPIVTPTDNGAFLVYSNPSAREHCYNHRRSTQSTSGRSATNLTCTPCTPVADWSTECEVLLSYLKHVVIDKCLHSCTSSAYSRKIYILNVCSIAKPHFNWHDYL